MFRTDLLSITRSLNTAYTAIGICHASSVSCLLARSGPRQQTANRTSMTNTNCRVYSVETPDNGQQICPKHVEFFIKNKFEKQCISLAFIIRIYQDARSSECHILWILYTVISQDYDCSVVLFPSSRKINERVEPLKKQ